MVETLGETQEDSSQEAPPSTGDLSASAPPLNHRVPPHTTPGTQPSRERERERVKWPPANSNIAWNLLDQSSRGHIGRITIQREGEHKRPDHWTSRATAQTKKGREASETEKGEGGQMCSVHQGPIQVHQHLVGEKQYLGD